jgi:hypothetical protein
MTVNFYLCCYYSNSIIIWGIEQLTKTFFAEYIITEISDTSDTTIAIASSSYNDVSTDLTESQTTHV